jgi:hypothetical protein
VTPVSSAGQRNDAAVLSPPCRTCDTRFLSCCGNSKPRGISDVGVPARRVLAQPLRLSSPTSSQRRCIGGSQKNVFSLQLWFADTVAMPRLPCRLEAPSVPSPCCVKTSISCIKTRQGGLASARNGRREVFKLWSFSVSIDNAQDSG